MNLHQRWKGIMKAYPFEEKRLVKYELPYIVQPKYNGFRCRALLYKSIGWVLLSSEENMFNLSVPHIVEWLEREQENFLDCLNFNRLESQDGLLLELDGELYTHGMSLEQISSIATQEIKVHPNHKELNYYIFDIVNNNTQILRILALDKINRDYRTNLSNQLSVKISPFYMASNMQEIEDIFSYLIREKYEGIIVRNLYGMYERKRSTNLMKFKPKKTDSYQIVSYLEEISIDGIPKNSLGTLILASGDETSNTFKCGSGFTREQRKELWKDKESLIGKWATIGYQHKSAKKVPLSSVFKELTNEKKGD